MPLRAGLTEKRPRYLFELECIASLLVLGQDVALDLFKELGKPRGCDGWHEAEA